MSRILRVALGCIASCGVACSVATGAEDEEVGEVVLQIAAAPSDARCLVVQATGSSGRTVTKSIDITAGQAATVQLSGVVAGSVTVSALAYSVTCSSVTATSAPTWANDPSSTTVTVMPGAAAQASIILRPTGSITSTIDWQSATCTRTAGSCTSPTVRLTDVTLPNAVTTYTESDTSVFPMAIAAMPSGDSRLAWLGTDSNVYVATLGCDDKIIGTPFKFPAVDLQDIIADANGGVVLLTRNATNGGTNNCGTGTLCGGAPSNPCRTMWMVRFNNAGAVEWETQVTNLSSSLAGYQDGARFVWWYQHHGRLAFNGTNYAAFFGAAITVNNGSCVDVHQGDRLQVVSSTGALVSNGSLAVGLSHAWTSRILWDSRTSKFVATDATDNTCRIANPVGSVTIAAGTCDGTLFNGDVVKSTTAGYWNAWSQSNSIRLDHFTTGASDKAISGVGTSAHPHLVAYGANNMLLVWASSTSATSVSAQVRTADSNASVVGSQFAIAINDHDFGAWKDYTDGSVAYAALGSTASSVKVARVMPCK